MAETSSIYLTGYIYICTPVVAESSDTLFVDWRSKNFLKGVELLVCFFVFSASPDLHMLPILHITNDDCNYSNKHSLAGNSTCPLHTNSGYRKERRILIGSW